MWQRFTEKARKVVFYAQEEAQKFGEGHVSTEHLLLGLLREENTARDVIAQIIGEPARLGDELRKRLPQGKVDPTADMTLMPRAKRVIDLAYDEARKLGDKFIGCEHLLLGLIREGDGLAARTLHNLRVTKEKAITELLGIRAQQVPTDAHVGLPPQQPRHIAFYELAKCAKKEGSVVSFAPGERSFGFLLGASIQEHLMLCLIAEEGKASEIIRAQVENVGALQWGIWNEIVQNAKVGVRGKYPDILPTLLELANSEAQGEPVRPEHILLALLDARWKDYQFATILQRAGLSLATSRQLLSPAA